MKAIKINAVINLTTDEVVATGGILVLNEFYLNLKGKTATTIPGQVSTSLYKSKNAYDNGKTPFTDISDFNNLFQINFLISEYESVGNFENKILDILVTQLLLIYPGGVITTNL